MLANILVGLCIAAFFGLFGVVVYFRFKVFKAYKVLFNNRVEFGRAHLLDKKKLEAEIIPKYPQFEDEIRTFVHGIRFSMKSVSLLVAIITLFAAILMFLPQD